jgi:hypothetical protein
MPTRIFRVLEQPDGIAIDLLDEDKICTDTPFTIRLGETKDIRVYDDEEQKWITTAAKYIGDQKFHFEDRDGFDWTGTVEELLEFKYVRFIKN